MATTTDLHRLRTLIAYLGEPASRHKDVIRAELYDFIRTIDADAIATFHIIQVSDPDLLEEYQAHHGPDILKEPRKSFARVSCPISLISYDDIPEENVLRLIRILKPYATSSAADLAALAVKLAITSNRPELIIPVWDILEIEPSLRDETVLSGDGTWFSRQPFEKFMRRYPHAGFDLPFEKLDTYIRRGHEHRRFLAIAIAILKGHDIRPCFAHYNHPQGGEWKHRLHRRMSSSHGLIQIAGSLPSISSLLDMDTKDLRYILADRSNNETKRLAKKERRLAAKAAAKALKAAEQAQAPQ
jgi:hypothetical protein